MAIFLVVLFQLAATNADAQVKAGSVSLSPVVGGYMFEGNQDIEDDFTYGINLGYHFTENWAAEAAFNFAATKFDDDLNEDLNVYLYRLDALYHFRPTEKLVPFVAFGVGGFTFDPDGSSSDKDFAADYGAGIKYFLNEAVALRLDVRHVLDFDGGDRYNNLLYTAGVSFQFGGKTPMAAVEPPPPAPAPAPPVVEADSDGDGVVDSKDKCPDTPRGVKVDSFGCPLDSDGDGVPDYLDKCPNTPKGVKVNEAGCWVCKGLNFDFNKSDIKPMYYPCLDETVDYLNSQPAMNVEVQGHTDNIGSQKYNQKLSEERAMSVMNYLVSKGIAKERLSIKGFGFSNPVDTNNTEEGRAKNRRVQFNPTN
jgi:OOP family OmpA-OmpF porin